MFFKKKNKVEFEFTQQVGDYVKYDELQRRFLFQNKTIVNCEEIIDYKLTYGNKTYTKKNLGTALAAGTLFGVGGYILAGTHQEEYVSNITVSIKTANNGVIYIPLTIGKMKMSHAKGILESAERIVALLDAHTGEYFEEEN